MSDARSAIGFDRLPWLTDEPPPAKTAWEMRRVVAWAAPALMIVAGASYWIGANSSAERRSARPIESSTTVALPKPKVRQPQSRNSPAPPDPVTKVAPAQAPEVRPSPQREVRISRPQRKAATAASERSIAKAPAPGRSQSPAVAATVKPPAAPSAGAARSIALWPSRQVSGAAGRLVQIGAFGTREQAKLGWRRMTRAYPAVGNLPAVVVPASNSRGRVFYRFQIGTTSQAHSEVLCQRMQRIHFSCAVVGLPWKAKVER